MNLAQQLEALQARGFAQEAAHTVVLIREAAILLFQAFPDSFLLYGGTNLILFQNSVRTSRDLDLFTPSGQAPDPAAAAEVLSAGLRPLAELLHLGPLTVRVQQAKPGFARIETIGNDQRLLFTVDLGGIAQVLQSGVEQHVMEAVSTDTTATIRYVSRDHILLQKAEAFLFRRAVKPRDAYDIKLLLDAGATLSGELENHLTDALRMNEVNEESIHERIDKLTVKLCRVELADVLPPEIYRSLEKEEFEPLRTAVRKLFQKWI